GLQVTDLSIGRVPDGTGSWVLTASTPEAANQAVTLALPLGHLIINEWMATNSSGPDWLELYNNATNPVALAGLVFTSVAPPTAPSNRAMTNLSFIAAGDFIRLDCVGAPAAKDPDELDFKLSHNTGETVTLYQPDRATVIYQISFPGINQIPGFWAPDVSYGWLPDGMTNRLFKFGSAPGGIGKPTPGASNFAPITNVVVSEVLSHTDLPLEDAVELHNPTDTAVDISGWWISNEKDNFRKFWVPANTVIAPFGFHVFYEWAGIKTNIALNPNGVGTNRSFSFNSARGDMVYVFATDGTTNLNGFRTGESFDPAPNGVSYGRYVTSEGKVDFVLQSQLSFGTSVTRTDPTNLIHVFRTGLGATNAYPRMGPLVINEIMYHPPDIIVGTNRIDDSTNEFIEIYNPTADPVALYDTNGLYFDPNIPPWDTQPFADGRTNTWRLRGEVDFEFPTNLVLNAGRYLLVVNFSPTNTAELDAFRQRYYIPTNFNRIFGPYRGKLGNGSGSVELQRPDTPQGPNNPADFADRLVPYYLIERVKYYDSTPWPTNADGGGYSLQRLRTEEYANDPTNWTSTLPSPGRPTDTNTPPELAPIASVTIDELKLLTITNVATDPDVPAQTLVYTLDALAPVRAQINQQGVFSWRPLEADGPGVYPITVRVTDNGTPPRSTTQSFTVTVREVNQPPVFNIREKWVKAGTTLAFPTAFDYDLPPQKLAFTKTAGPAGASVDAASGIVSWSPSDADVGTNWLTIRVEDNGDPPMSASYTYVVHVLGSSATLVVAEDVVFVTGSAVKISWEATIDKLYQVEYTDDLGSGSWQPLGNAVIADQSKMTLTDDTPAWMRFYRIIQVD
ncbi:MAG: lamin tail domain-containing protein, partial [Methanothrix sp.]|nr:lamin tail domain-containing protein [Methanothrix sp.]